LAGIESIAGVVICVIEPSRAKFARIRPPIDSISGKAHAITAIPTRSALYVAEM
jgi:hypothetical protein